MFDHVCGSCFCVCIWFVWTLVLGYCCLEQHTGFFNRVTFLSSGSESYHQANQVTMLKKHLVCPVAECQTAVGNNSDFRRHWKEKHVAVVVMYNCASCEYRAKRKTNVTRHAFFLHGLSKDEAMGRAQPQDNKGFIDPTPWTLEVAQMYIRKWLQFEPWLLF